MAIDVTLWSSQGSNNSPMPIIPRCVPHVALWSWQGSNNFPMPIIPWCVPLSPTYSRCGENLPQVQASLGADFPLGRTKMSLHRPCKFPRCDGAFMIRRELSSHRDNRPENLSSENTNHFRYGADQEALKLDKKFQEVKQSMRLCMCTYAKVGESN